MKPVFVIQRIHRADRTVAILLTQTSVTVWARGHRDYQFELLQTCKTIQVARARYGSGSHVVDLVRKKTMGLTLESRGSMAAKKRGARNPNSGGLSRSHKAAISRAMTGTRRGDNNPMAGRRHSTVTRQKMAKAARARRGTTTWVMEPTGRPHRVPVEFVLPPGWMTGRGRESGRY